MRFLLQPTRPFEFTSAIVDHLVSPLLWPKPLSTLIFAFPKLRSRFTRRLINERIVEIPFVLSHLPNRPVRILDVGACESPLSLMLASLGHRVTALDIRPYPFFHPNLSVQTSDITRYNSSQKFDVIICLSVLEHIGLPVYGSPAISNGDRQAIVQMHKLLKPGGKLVLTTPIAPRSRLTPSWRIHDPVALSRLFSQFKSLTLKIAAKNKLQQWQIVPRLPKQFLSEEYAPAAVALIIATK